MDQKLGNSIAGAIRATPNDLEVIYSNSAMKLDEFENPLTHKRKP